MRRSPGQVHAGVGAEGGKRQRKRWWRAGRAAASAARVVAMRRPRGEKEAVPGEPLGAHGAPGRSAPEASGAARFGTGNNGGSGLEAVARELGGRGTRGVSVSRA